MDIKKRESAAGPSTGPTTRSAPKHVYDPWKYLPVEIIEYILRKCDTITLFHMTEAYPNLKHICTDPRFHKVITLDLPVWSNVDMKKMIAFLKHQINTCLIFRGRHLNFRIFGELKKILLKMKRVKCLDFTGTELKLPWIAGLLENLPTVKCVHFNFSSCTSLNVVTGNLIRLVKACPESLHIEIYEPQHLSQFSYFSKLLHESMAAGWRPKKKINLDLTLCFENNYTNVFLSSLINDAYNTISITVGFFLSSICTFPLLADLDRSLMDSYFIFIETYNSLYATKAIYDLIVSQTKTEAQKLRLRLYPIPTNNNNNRFKKDHVIGFFACKREDDYNINKLLVHILERKRYRNRAVYYVPTKSCLLKKETFRVLQNRKSLVASTCLLAMKKEETPVENEPLFKKPRISRVSETPKDPGFLPTIIESNKNLETLIISNSDNHVCHSSPNITYNFKSLWSIGLLNNLKHLFLTLIPIESPKDFFIHIFENCPLLTSLIIETNALKSQGTESLATNLKLCKHIKVFMIKSCYVSNLSNFLNILSNCPSLEYIKMTKMSCLNESAGTPSLNSVENLIIKCPNLLYLGIEQRFLSRKELVEMRAIMNRARGIRPNICIDLYNSPNYARVDHESMPLYQTSPFHRFKT